MLKPIYKSSFKRDVRRVVRRGKSLERIMDAVRLLCAQQPLPAAFRDHALKGKFAGYRDCHVEPDLVLIYRIVEGRLELVCFRLGSHADLFSK